MKFEKLKYVNYIVIDRLDESRIDDGEQYEQRV